MKAKLTNMHKPNMCCEELPVLIQEFTGNYSVPKYMEPTTHYLKEICTRRICTSSYMPCYNVGRSKDEQWVFIQPNGKVAPGKPPAKMHPIQYHRSLTQNSDKLFCSDKQIESRPLEKKNNLGREISSTTELAIAQNLIASINNKADDAYENL